MSYIPPPTGWYTFGTHVTWSPVPALEFSKELDEDHFPRWERLALSCSTTECAKPGIEVVTGVVLCRQHRKRMWFGLRDIHKAEMKQQSLKNQQDRDIRRVAYQEAGSRRPYLDPMKGPMRTEVSGGRFEENRSKH